MLFLFRRLIKQFVLTAIIGFVIRKLMSSNDPRTKRIGEGANKLVGGVIGLDANANPVPRRRGRGMAKRAATAAAGGAMSYFFDPAQGAQRRQRVKRYASEKLNRNGQPPMLPAAETGSPIPAHAAAPGVTS